MNNLFSGNFILLKLRKFWNIAWYRSSHLVVETELLSHTTSSEIKDGYENWKESMGGVISPSDIAKTVLFAYQQPQNVCIREIVVAATAQHALPT